MQDIRAIAGPLAKSHGVDLQWILPDNEDLEVATDSIRLSQIVLNLIHNAVKFSEGESPVVRVTAAWTPPDLCVWVDDEGPGLDPQLLPRLFADYEQMPAHARHPDRGIGLGLGIVRENARILNAHLHAENRSPRGLSFQLCLPAAPS